MEVISYTKNSRMSPVKVREVARVIQGKSAVETAERLKFYPRKSAALILKTLQSAIANAENNHNLNSDDLVIKSAIVEQGISFRRFRPASRGSAHPYKKRTSHIKIILTDEK